MDHIYQQAVLALGASACIESAMRECSQLAAQLGVTIVRQCRTPAAVAAAIADMEVACDQLRQIVGSELVDLEKVASVARLQARIHDAARLPAGTGIQRLPSRIGEK